MWVSKTGMCCWLSPTVHGADLEAQFVRDSEDFREPLGQRLSVGAQHARALSGTSAREPQRLDPAIEGKASSDRTQHG